MRKLLLTSVSAIFLLACQPGETTRTVETVTFTQEDITENNAAIDAWFDQKFNESVMRSPITQTYLGMRDNEDYGRWDDPSEAADAKDLEIAKAEFAELKDKFDPRGLGETQALSYRLAVKNYEDQIEGYKWRNHSYPFNQMYGAHSRIPAFLINNHTISTEAHAEAYISRVKGVPAYMSGVVERSNASAANGIQPPRFVYDLLLSDIGNLTKGAPFTKGEDHALLADFKKKVGKLDIPQERKDALIAELEEALLNAFGPAYAELTAALTAQAETATTDDGAWKLPGGGDFYAWRLRQMTTTDMSADEIHEVGLSEVARIHGEMRDIMKKVGFDGTLQEFFVFMRTDPQFYYPNTEAGKAEYLATATAMIDTMETRLDEVFLRKPKADMIVKAVEPFREKTAGKAFYDRPAPDGSKPGIYYANLYDMAQMPIYQMEALAYHEGIPGHHMQIAIAQELEGIPMFRKFGGYTPYIEGWGLYSEYLPKEMGFYEDPYSDFGRLAMELWRAARLVVDTGLHHKKWTREEAIDYLLENTPNPEGDSIKAIERYIVMPGQATAYKIGMIKILELREDARARLGDKFDIREFHDVILASGPVPLDVMEERVEAWVESKG